MSLPLYLSTCLPLEVALATSENAGEVQSYCRVFRGDTEGKLDALVTESENYPFAIPEDAPPPATAGCSSLSAIEKTQKVLNYIMQKLRRTSSFSYSGFTNDVSVVAQVVRELQQIVWPSREENALTRPVDALIATIQHLKREIEGRRPTPGSENDIAALLFSSILTDLQVWKEKRGPLISSAGDEDTDDISELIWEEETPALPVLNLPVEGEAAAKIRDVCGEEPDAIGYWVCVKGVGGAGERPASLSRLVFPKPGGEDPKAGVARMWESIKSWFESWWYRSDKNVLKSAAEAKYGGRPK